MERPCFKETYKDIEYNDSNNCCPQKCQCKNISPAPPAPATTATITNSYITKKSPFHLATASRQIMFYFILVTGRLFEVSTLTLT